MSTCLTTKLDGVVNDDSFRTPSELRIEIKEQDSYIQSRAWIKLTSRKNQTIVLVNDKSGENYFFDVNGNNLGTSVDLAAGTQRQIYCTNGNYEISIPNKYAINYIDTGRFAPQMDFFNIDIDEFKYIPTVSTIILSGTNTKGDIKSLANSPTILDLTLEYTNVKGDLEDLAPLTSLRYMRFAVSNDVTGDLSVVENMPDIRNIEIWNCIGITGDLSSLANCSQLRWIAFPNISGLPSITGDIAVFSDKTLLNSISIEAEPGVEGDIAAFASNTNNLHTLYLGSTKVEGDIADLAPCQRLANLRINYNPNIEGNFATFLQNKPYLTYFDMTSTSIEGDITNNQLPLLTTGYFNSTGVTGSIGKVDTTAYTVESTNTVIPAHSAEDGFIKHSPALILFQCTNTQLEGDIDVFANCAALTNLNIYNSNISGNISSLSGLTALTYINIGYTDVYGDIGEGLSGCTNLTQLFVEHCPNLTGDLSQLSPNVRYMSASNSSGPFTWENTRPSSAYIIAMDLVKLGDDLDAMLINQANCQPNRSNASTLWNAINVRGNRSSDPIVRANANAAIITLMNKGYAVTINGTLQTEALVGADAALVNE